MTVEIAPLTMKPPRLCGLSQQMLDRHYEHVYGTAVQRLNAMSKSLAKRTSEPTWTTGTDYRRARRLEATNSIVLHEIYFDSLGGAGGHPESSRMTTSLARDFGSVELWQQDFVAMNKALGYDDGWGVLSWSHRFGQLTNHWIDEKAAGPVGATPILALDMYAHAYEHDFGSEIDRYIETFMCNLDWTHVSNRFQECVLDDPAPNEPGDNFITATNLRRLLKSPNEPTPLVLDVRLAQDRDRDTLPDAAWRDMEQVDDWCRDLPNDRPIVVYCVYGFWVSQDTAAAIRARGYDARTLAGGISAWRASGFPTHPLRDTLDTLADS